MPIRLPISPVNDFHTRIAKSLSFLEFCVCIPLAGYVCTRWRIECWLFGKIFAERCLHFHETVSLTREQVNIGPFVSSGMYLSRLNSVKVSKFNIFYYIGEWMVYFSAKIWCVIVEKFVLKNIYLFEDLHFYRTRDRSLFITCSLIDYFFYIRVLKELQD